MKYFINEKLEAALTALKNHCDFQQNSDWAILETRGDISSVGARATYPGDIRLRMPVKFTTFDIAEAYDEDFYKAIAREVFGWIENPINYYGAHQERSFGFVPGDYYFRDGNLFFNGETKISSTGCLLIYSDAPMMGYSGPRNIIHLSMNGLYAIIFPLGFFINHTATRNNFKNPNAAIEVMNNHFQYL